MAELGILNTEAVPEVAQSALADARLPIAVPSSGDAAVADLLGITYLNLARYVAGSVILTGTGVAR